MEGCETEAEALEDMEDMAESTEDLRAISSACVAVADGAMLYGELGGEDDCESRLGEVALR